MDRFAEFVGDACFHARKGDSHSGETASGVDRVLDGAELDFPFIEGKYTYEWVKRDFERYGPKVAAGGIVAFYDSIERPGEPAMGVAQFLEQVSRGSNPR